MYQYKKVKINLSIKLVKIDNKFNQALLINYLKHLLQIFTLNIFLNKIMIMIIKTILYTDIHMYHQHCSWLNCSNKTFAIINQQMIKEI